MALSINTRTEINSSFLFGCVPLQTLSKYICVFKTTESDELVHDEAGAGGAEAPLGGVNHAKIEVSDNSC